MARLMVVASLLSSLAAAPSANAQDSVPDDAVCIDAVRVTGYVRGHHSPWTADGTSVWSREPIAAAGYGIPMGAHVQVPDVGIFVVHDRGMLGYANVDVLVDSLSEAYALTDTKSVCWWMP